MRIARRINDIALAAVAAMVAVPAAADCVVLLHGLGRSPLSMVVPQLYLEHHGYLVVNHGYPSTSAPIQDLAPEVGKAIAECPEDQTVHIVTHSMGGILARKWLGDHRPANLGRVVMLAPPHHGSELVDILRQVPGYIHFNGPAGQELGTTADAVPGSLGPVDFPLGVIAGTGTANWLASALIPGPDDGKVAVEATKVQGMADHITLPLTHTFMMNNPETLAQILAFLQNGKFDR